MDCPTLLSIPLELRNLIYSFLLVSSSSIELRSPSFQQSVAGARTIARPLLLVNKQLYQEGSHFLYSANTFTIGNSTNPESSHANINGLKSFIRCVPPAHRACIRKIHLRTRLWKERWHRLARYYDGDGEGEYREGREVEWLAGHVAKHFTGVQSIRISLDARLGVQRALPKKPSSDSDNLQTILKALILFLDMPQVEVIRLTRRKYKDNLAIVDKLLEVKPDAGKIVTVARSMFD